MQRIVNEDAIGVIGDSFNFGRGRHIVRNDILELVDALETGIQRPIVLLFIARIKNKH